MHEGFRPLHLSDCFTSHYVCVIILMCWLLGVFPQVLAYGPASDRSSSVTHSLPHTTCTQHIIHFPRRLLQVCQPTPNKPSQLQHHTTNLVEIYVKPPNTPLSRTVKSEHTGYPPAQRSKSWTSGCLTNHPTASLCQTVPVTTFVCVQCSLKTT